MYRWSFLLNKHLDNQERMGHILQQIPSYSINGLTDMDVSFLIFLLTKQNQVFNKFYSILLKYN